MCCCSCLTCFHVLVGADSWCAWTTYCPTCATSSDHRPLLRSINSLDLGAGKGARGGAEEGSEERKKGKCEELPQENEAELMDCT